MARPARPWYWEARDVWVVTIAGRRHTLARGKGAKKEATRRFHALMAAAGPERAPAAPRAVKAVFNLYLADLQALVDRGKRSAVTHRGARWYIESFLKSAPGLAVEDLRPRHVTRWLNAQDWGPTSAANAAKVLLKSLNWARRQGHLADNPLADLECPRPGRRQAIPTAGQAEAMLRRSEGTSLHDFALALRETGCRPTEVRAVTAAMVDLASGTWEVPNKTRRATGKSTRTVYLSPAMVELSRRLCAAHPEGPIFRSGRGRPWTAKAVCAAFDRLRGRLGYGPEAVAYGFRHLFITDALERGIPPATVAELVGHEGLAMIMKALLSHLSERKQPPPRGRADRQARCGSGRARPGPSRSSSRARPASGDFSRGSTRRDFT
jgi:integrase/recombinase XerC